MQSSLLGNLLEKNECFLVIIKTQVIYSHSRGGTLLVSEGGDASKLNF